MPKAVVIHKIAGKPDKEMLLRINQKLEECAAKLDYTHEMPTISFDLKGQTAGYAWYQKNHIQLNGDLLMKETEDMIEDTLPHEFAHIASYKFYGRDGVGHGRNWKWTMIRLGLEPKRCHNYEVTPAKIHQKFNYTCDCPGTIHKIGKNVHNKIQSGLSPRYCKRCGAWIKES
jgi:SprT protein